MQVRWYGQSAFTLTGSSTTVTIDPFGEFPDRPGSDARRRSASSIRPTTSSPATR